MKKKVILATTTLTKKNPNNPQQDDINKFWSTQAIKDYIEIKLNETELCALTSVN